MASPNDLSGDAQLPGGNLKLWIMPAVLELFAFPFAWISVQMLHDKEPWKRIIAYAITGTVLCVVGVLWAIFRKRLADLFPWHKLEIAREELARVLAENAELRKRKEESAAAPAPSLSKLKIISANYATRSGEGPKYDLTEFLEKITAGDCLVIDEIANHSFHFGGHDYGGEPRFGHKKRVQVTYSFNGGAPCTIDRSEGFRLVLPEEKEGLLCSLQMEAFMLAKELRDFHASLGPYPSDPTQNLGEITLSIWCGCLWSGPRSGKRGSAGYLTVLQIASLGKE